MKLLYTALISLLLLSTAAVADEASARATALKRISPVNMVMDVQPNSARCFGFRAGSDYNITYTVMGYDSEYVTRVGLWDCTDAVAGKCGDTYSNGDSHIDGFRYRWMSGTLESNASSDWTYQPSGDVVVHANEMSFSLTYDVNSTRYDGNSWGNLGDANQTQVVLRWYQRSNTMESEGELNTISIILGSEAGYHYGNNARRIQTTVSEDAYYGDLADYPGGAISPQTCQPL